MDQTCGGYGPTEDATGAIQKICDQVKTQVEQMTNKKYKTYKAEKYRSQLVNGNNYVIKVDAGVEYIHLQIYQSFKGQTQLNGVQQHHSKDDPLKPF